MPNAYFNFRQFSIRQDRCAMKVCTDSCMLGAWTASRITAAKKVLDIGTGTGLLSLMLAQKNNASIDAIEEDREASVQAKENIAASPWSDRIRVIHQDVRSYAGESRYDFIVSNPPFFEGDLVSPVREKNKARHAETLNLETLITVIKKLLHAEGAFSLLIPFLRSDYLEKLAHAKGYWLQEKILIRQTATHEPFRSLLLFAAKESAPVEVKEFIIRDGAGKETPELLELMKDYYIR